MMIEPNEARVMLFFGVYKGTLNDNGFWWVNPFYAKKKMTYRARNLDIEPIKVNDQGRQSGDDRARAGMEGEGYL